MPHGLVPFADLVHVAVFLDDVDAVDEAGDDGAELLHQVVLDQGLQQQGDQHLPESGREAKRTCEKCFIPIFFVVFEALNPLLRKKN